MKAIKVTTEVREDRRVTFSVPDDTPTGKAEVIVLITEESLSERGQTLRGFLEGPADRNLRERGCGEIDGYLRCERMSWKRE